MDRRLTEVDGYVKDRDSRNGLPTDGEVQSDPEPGVETLRVFVRVATLDPLWQSLSWNDEAWRKKMQRKYKQHCLFQISPIMCGLYLQRLRVLFYDTGRRILLSGTAMRCISSLYVAGERYGYQKSKWEDLELALLGLKEANVLGSDAVRDGHGDPLMNLLLSLGFSGSFILSPRKIMEQQRTFRNRLTGVPTKQGLVSHRLMATNDGRRICLEWTNTDMIKLIDMAGWRIGPGSWRDKPCITVQPPNMISIKTPAPKDMAIWLPRNFSRTLSILAVAIERDRLTMAFPFISMRSRLAAANDSVSRTLEKPGALERLKLPKDRILYEEMEPDDWHMQSPFQVAGKIFCNDKQVQAHTRQDIHPYLREAVAAMEKLYAGDKSDEVTREWLAQYQVRSVARCIEDESIIATAYGGG